MARRISPSQFRSQIRQAQSKLRQAATKQKQAVDRLNREIRARNQKSKRAVDNYNRAVRAHDTQLRANRRRLEQELSRLRSGSVTRSTRRVTVSAQSVHTAFVRVEARRQAGAVYPEPLFSLFEDEATNSLRAANAIDGGDAADAEEISELQETSLSTELQAFSPELESRWRGALYSLSPQNPDAARHFCTSARECIVKILDVAAPDEVVMRELPNYTKTDDGRLSRRSKLRYLLVRQGLADDAVEDFVNEDVEDILRLFRVFNDATHGNAGRFELNELVAVKARAESGIRLLHSLAS